MRVRLALLLLASYFILTPFFVLFLVSYHANLYKQSLLVAKKQDVKIVKIEKIEESIKVPPAVQLTRVTYEAKIAALEKFFGRYGSPLENYAKDIVDAAENYGLDYRLLPAIAMQESLLCLKAPTGTNNCWGFGIYGKKKTSFESLSDAIEIISKTLSRDYHGKGLVEPEQIMTRYAPANTNSWAQKVTYVMNRIGTAL